MPDATSIKKFAKSLKTGKTDVTKALDQLMGERDSIPAIIAALRSAPTLSPLPDWARQALKDRGVNDKELDHIDNWPDAQKKQRIQQKLIDAIDNNRPVHFFWELHGRDDEDTVMDDPDDDGNITVTFRSPRRKVNVWPANVGSISVDVQQ